MRRGWLQSIEDCSKSLVRVRRLIIGRVIEDVVPNVLVRGARERIQNFVLRRVLTLDMEGSMLLRWSVLSRDVKQRVMISRAFFAACFSFAVPGAMSREETAVASGRDSDEPTAI